MPDHVEYLTELKALSGDNPPEFVSKKFEDFIKGLSSFKIRNMVNKPDGFTFLRFWLIFLEGFFKIDFF